MRVLWVLVVGMVRVTWTAFRTVWMTLIVLLFLGSMAMNIMVFSAGAIATAVASAVEAVTGVATVLTRFKGKATEAAKWEGKAAGAEQRLAEVQTNASKWEGKAVGMELRAAKLETRAAELSGELIGTKLLLASSVKESAKLGVEAIGLRAARKVKIEGAEMAVKDAIKMVATRIKTRTAKVASADIGATLGQSLPWIGVAVVVSATGYDLKVSCDNMRDMHALDLAFNPETADDPNVDYVCGLKVPTKEEVWAGIKASPGASWDMAKAALHELPDMPEMPSVDWPPMPEIGMPTVPDINWEFWKLCHPVHHETPGGFGYRGTRLRLIFFQIS